MKKLFFTIFVSLCLLVQAQITKPVGINIAGVSDYSTELVFTDAFKQCRDWISSNATGGVAWDTNITIPLSAQGYPLQIPYSDGLNPPQIVKTLMLWDIGTAVPQGQYRLIVAGNGQVKLSFGASGTYTCPIDTYINVTGQVMLEITNSDVANPISDIKFIYPNYTNTYQNQPFTTEFLSFLNDFQVIRMMDFTNTNGSPIVQWADRTPYDYYTQGKFGGVAWEYVIELANTTQKDIWINIPHKANDLYINNLANLLQNTLHPNLKIYIEFSNEVWNGAFSQHNDCATMAQNLGYTGQSWERAWKFTAKRSADTFKIFEDVFTNDQRLIKIIPSQAANSWLTNQLITYFNDSFYNPNQVLASAVCIAPYFGNEVADQIITEGIESTITIPEIIQRLQNAQTQSFQWIMNNKTVADNHSLDLICYEGGQHLVATGNNVNNDVLTPKLIAANNNASLQSIYCQYLNYWYTNVGKLFCHFSSHGTYSKWGSWGVKQNFQDVTNPKYLALQNCVFAANTLENETFTRSDAIIYPNPASEKLYYSKGGVYEYQIFNLLGTKIQTGTTENIDISSLKSNIYIIKIEDTHYKFIKE